jgi:hypothetical protein
MTSIQSLLRIRAVQNSTSTFSSNALQYPVTDCINTANEGTMVYTTSTNGLVNGNVTYQQSADLNAFIMAPGTLQGFSFQHFGGYSPATMQVAYTMTVNVTRGSISNQRRTINFTLSSIGATQDGSMTFIPFSPNFFSTPPSLLVGSIAYTGDDVKNVIRGDIVLVRLTTNRSDGGGVMCTAYPTQQLSYLIGSLVTDIDIQAQTFGETLGGGSSYFHNLVNGGVIFTSSVRDIINSMGSSAIWLYQIVLNGINFTSAPTTSAPAKLIIKIATNTGFFWEIKVTCNRNPDSSMIVPLNMPAPGEEYSESYAVNNNSSMFVTSVQQGDTGASWQIRNRGVNTWPNNGVNTVPVARASYPMISIMGMAISFSQTGEESNNVFDINLNVTVVSDSGSPATMSGQAGTRACLFNGLLI